MRLISALALLLLPAAALADTLQLANGNVLKGIVVGQTPTSVDFQFAWQGDITFQNSEITYIVKDSSAANAALLEDWHERQVDFNEALQQDQDYDAQQEQQGLEQSAGAWVGNDAEDQAESSDEDDGGPLEEDASQPDDSSDQSQAPAATADSVPQTTLVSYVGPPPVPNQHYHQRHKHPKPRPDQPPFRETAQVVQPMTTPIVQPLSIIPTVAQQPPVWQSQPQPRPSEPGRGRPNR